MRKLLATAAAAALLTAALPTSAWAAVPDAPTDVQVAWDGNKIRVTWKDNGEANVIQEEYVDDGLVYRDGTTTADQANELVIPARFLDRDRIRFRVTSRGAGQELSAAGTSPLFDARIPVYPFVEDADLLADGSVRLTWRQPAVEDLTPNDPLDRPVSAEYLGVNVGPPGSQTKEQIAIPVGSTSFVVPARPRPWTISMYAGNEWRASYLHQDGNGPWHERVVNIGTAQTGISGVAPQVRYGDDLMIQASLTTSLGVNYFDSVQLQARPTSSAAWKTYGRFAGYSNDDPINTPIGSLGGREYRIWVPGLKRVEQMYINLTPAASSSAKASRTVSNMIITRFEPSRPKLGEITKLNVHVLPEIAMNAALHQWDGKQWRYVRAVPLKNGAAIIPIKATRRGTTTWRIATPPLTVKGLPVLLTTSKPFTLTVR